MTTTTIEQLPDQIKDALRTAYKIGESAMYFRDTAPGRFNELLDSTIAALPLPVMSSQEDDMISLPRGLVAAACSAIDKKRDAPVVLAKLHEYVIGAEVMPEQAEPVAKRELIDLYKSINNMMLAIGMHGVVESHDKCVKDVMNALYALDDGYAIIRANDLAEKAFVPFNQAFPKAVSEYIDKLEGRLNTFDLLARIAELEAEIQKLKEDAAWIPIEQCRLGKAVIVRIDDVVQHVIVERDDAEWLVCESGEVIEDFHPTHFRNLPE